MTEDYFDDSSTPTEQQIRLARENVARLLAFKANPPPAAPQKDYVAKSLATPLRVLPKRTHERSPAALAHRQAKSFQRAAAHQREPVRMTAVAPCPPSSESILDGSK